MNAHAAPVLIGWEQGPVRRVRVERRTCTCIDCGATFEATVKAGKVPPRCPRCRADYDWNVLRPRRLADCRKRNPARYPSSRLSAAHRERRRKRRAAGLCVVCETPTPHYRCDDCRADFNAARSARKARHVKPPRCVDCGIAMPGARADRQRCDWHRRVHANKRHRVYHRRSGEDSNAEPTRASTPGRVGHGEPETQLSPEKHTGRAETTDTRAPSFPGE